MMFQRYVVLFISVFQLVAFATEESCTDKDQCSWLTDENSNHYGETVEWIRENGGFIDPRQGVRLSDPEDVNSGYGIFAEDDIEQDELLLSIPWGLIIKADWADYYDYADEIEIGSEYDFEGGFDFCGVVRNLAWEMRLDDDSRFAPYVRRLNLQPDGQLPEAWTDEAKSLLEEIKGPSIFMNFQAHVVTDYLFNQCDFFEKDGYDVNVMKKTDEEGYYLVHIVGDDVWFINHVAMLVTQRGEDDLMIPYYEYYNHQNGPLLNTWTEINRGESVDVYARSDIKAGSEIFHSYNLGNNCQQRINSFSFGTIQIFNDYGFIERYPQRWIFDDDNFRFDLKPKQQGKGNDDDDDDLFDVEWCPTCKPLPEEDIQYYEDELKRLQNLSPLKEKGIEEYPGILQHEWDLIWDFHHAVIVALSYGLKKALRVD